MKLHTPTHTHTRTHQHTRTHTAIVTGFWPSRISQCFFFYFLYFFRRIFHVSAKQRTGEQNGERATTTVSQYNNYRILGKKYFNCKYNKCICCPKPPPPSCHSYCSSISAAEKSRKNCVTYINVRVYVCLCVCAGPPRNVKSEIVRRP